MLDKLTDLVLRHPKKVILLTLLASLFFANGLRFMHADTDVTRDLPDDIPAKEVFNRIDKLFPAKEMIVVGIHDDKLLSVDSIARLDRLSKSLQKLKGVQSVMSLSSAKIISGKDGSMQVRAAADPLPNDAASLKDFRDKIMAQPLIRDNLLSADAQATALMIFIKAGVRAADVAARVIALADDAQASQGFKLYVTGRPAATYWSKKIMGRDMGMLTSAALLIVLLMLAISFRSLRGVLLPIGVVVTAVIWTMGLMGYIGQPLTHSTEIMPILLVAIGVADGIHIIKGYYQRARDAQTGPEVVRATMRELNLPVVFTSVTTMAGFLALGTAGVESIMVLGALTAFGVLAAMIFSLTLIPASLSLMRLPKNSQVSDAAAGKGQRMVLLEKIAGAYANFLVRRKVAVSVAVLLVIALAVWGGTRVKSEFSNLSNFKSDHPFLTASLMVNKNFASISNIIIVVETGKPDGIKDPVLLHKMDKLQQWLKKQPHVGAVQSLVGFIKQMNKVMHDDKQAYYRIPATTEQEQGIDYVEENGVEVEKPVTFTVPGQQLIAQYLALYEMSGKPDDFANVVTYDYSTARMTIMLDSDDASVLSKIHRDVQAYLDKNFGDTKAELTGMAELMRAVNEMVVRAQAWSILSSLGLVLLLSGLMFRSFWLGVFSTLPLFFSLFLNFGFMGWLGIPLNIMTMTTSAIAVGVGVDYAIHFVYRYRHDLQQGLDFDAAVPVSMRASGVAIFLNAVTVALGFFALFFSQFRGVGHMGLLITLTMVTSAFAALTLLPVMFVLLKPKAFYKGEKPS